MDDLAKAIFESSYEHQQYFFTSLQKRLKALQEEILQRRVEKRKCPHPEPYLKNKTTLGQKNLTFFCVLCGTEFSVPRMRD